MTLDDVAALSRCPIVTRRALVVGRCARHETGRLLFLARNRRRPVVKNKLGNPRDLGERRLPVADDIDAARIDGWRANKGNGKTLLIATLSERE